MRGFRGFCAAFIITVCILGLGVGLFTVGYHSQRTMTGSVPTYRLEQGRMVVTDADTVVFAVGAADTPLIPAPARLFAGIVRQTAVIAQTVAAHLHG